MSQRFVSLDLNSRPPSDIPLQFGKPFRLHLWPCREEAPHRLCIRSALHPRDTATTDGRTGYGAPHDKPQVRPSISFPDLIPPMAPSGQARRSAQRGGKKCHFLATRQSFTGAGPCLPHLDRHICGAGPKTGIRALRRSTYYSWAAQVLHFWQREFNEVLVSWRLFPWRPTSWRKR